MAGALFHHADAVEQKQGEENDAEHIEHGEKHPLDPVRKRVEHDLHADVLAPGDARRDREQRGPDHQIAGRFLHEGEGKRNQIADENPEPDVQHQQDGEDDADPFDDPAQTLTRPGSPVAEYLQPAGQIELSFAVLILRPFYANAGATISGALSANNMNPGAESEGMQSESKMLRTAPARRRRALPQSALETLRHRAQRNAPSGRRGDRGCDPLGAFTVSTSANQYSATGLPGDPVAPFIFSGDQTNRNS